MPDDDVCGICRVQFDGTCSTCKFPGDDCPLCMFGLLVLSRKSNSEFDNKIPSSDRKMRASFPHGRYIRSTLAVENMKLSSNTEFFLPSTALMIGSRKKVQSSCVQCAGKVSSLRVLCYAVC